MRGRHGRDRRSVERVATIVGEIGQASQTQRSGIDEVNAAVAEIDELTRQNAALVTAAADAVQRHWKARPPS